MRKERVRTLSFILNLWKMWGECFFFFFHSYNMYEFTFYPLTSSCGFPKCFKWHDDRSKTECRRQARQTGLGGCSKDLWPSVTPALKGRYVCACPSKCSSSPPHSVHMCICSAKSSPHSWEVYKQMLYCNSVKICDRERLSHRWANEPAKSVSSEKRNHIQI